jgi:hypothetical protein
VTQRDTLASGSSPFEFREALQCLPLECRGVAGNLCLAFTLDMRRAGIKGFDELAQVPDQPVPASVGGVPVFGRHFSPLADADSLRPHDDLGAPNVTRLREATPGGLYQLIQ